MDPKFNPQQYGQAPQYPNYGTAASWDTGAPAATQVGWVAASAPGLLPLRPLTFGEIFSATFRLLRTNPKVSFGSSLIVTGVTSLITSIGPLLVILWYSNRLETANSQDSAVMYATMPFITLLSALPGLLLGSIGTLLFQAIMAQVVAAATLNRPLGFGEAWRRAGRRFWPMLGYIVLAGLIQAAVVLVVGALMAGFVWLMATNTDPEDPGVGMIVLAIFVSVVLFSALLVGLLYFQIKLLFGPSAVALEGLGPIQALKRSWSLSKDYFWRTFGVVLLVGIIVNVISQVASGITSLVAPLLIPVLVPLGEVSTGQEPLAITLVIIVGLLAMVVTTLVGALVAIVNTGNAVVMYADLRMRKEGLNIHLQRAAEQLAAGQPVDPEPWTAPDLGPVAESATPNFEPSYATTQAAPYGQNYGQNYSQNYGQPFGQPNQPTYPQTYEGAAGTETPSAQPFDAQPFGYGQSGYGQTTYGQQFDQGAWAPPQSATPNDAAMPPLPDAQLGASGSVPGGPASSSQGASSQNIGTGGTGTPPVAGQEGTEQQR